MAFDLFDEVNKILENTGIRQTDGMPDIPEQVRTFLGQLSMLNGVPWYYLIPDEKFLPKKLVSTNFANGEELIEQGSVRLFRLDKEWIECLMDGALSIGPDEDRQLLMSKAMAGNYVAEVFYKDTKEKIKKQLFGLYTPEEHEKELDKRLAAKNIKFLGDSKQPMPTIAQSNWCYTGFFMRSTIIASWVGVEVVAQGQDPDLDSKAVNPIRPLQVVRFERIAADTIFCICEGLISRVQITQPTEAVHFGLSKSESKYAVDKKEVLMRDAGAKGVVNITDLVNKLNVNNSAKFAEKMLSRPLKVTLNIKWKNENTSEKP